MTDLVRRASVRSATFMLAAVLAGCSQSVAPSGYGCTAAHGGDPRRCWSSLHLSEPRPALGASYHSAGTMSLAHATCVRARSQWWFHGAHHPVTKEISAEGNEVLRSAYDARYPEVRRYLDRMRALDSVRWTKLSGADLNSMGVPLCEY